jgi:hypothetical protein
MVKKRFVALLFLLKEQWQFHKEGATYNMSTGKIEVWIVGQESLCRVSQKNWTVCLFDCCSQSVVEFCNQEQCKETTCGTADFDVPPGCYVLLARSPNDNDIAFGVATVGCGQQVCITLVSPLPFLALATEEERQLFTQELEKMKPTPSS